MLRGGAAASTDQVQAVVGREAVVCVREFLRRQRVVGAIGRELRQSGVRHARDRQVGVLGQVAQVLGHLGGAGGAVESDGVDTDRAQRRQGRADLGPQEHGAGGLDGDLGDDRHVRVGSGHGPPGPDDRGFGLQQVLRGFDQDRVGAPVDQATDLFLIGITQHREVGMAQRGEFRAGANGTQHIAVLAIVVGIRHLAGDSRTGFGEFVDAVDDVVLGQIGPVGAERVRLDGIDADVEVRAMHPRDDLGPGDIEDLVAAVEVLEVRQGQIRRLQHRAHRPVSDQDPLEHGIEQGGLRRNRHNRQNRPRRDRGTCR